MKLKQSGTGKSISVHNPILFFASERETVDEAWPGDVIGLVNASGLRVGDSLYEGPAGGASAVVYPPVPAFPPELIATAHPRDLSRSKQFKRGLAQLEQEGVVQILRRGGDDPTPVLAAVGVNVCSGAECAPPAQSQPLADNEVWQSSAYG